ncbi:MAG: F0F1 ATP synthase subunit gamma, partial [Bacteroidota bacterium]
MPNLRDIRNRISTVNNTQQITKAMKMVAAAKLRKAQDRMIQTRPYAAKIKEVASRLVGSVVSSNPVLRKPDRTQRTLLIVVGSDRGLCGGFNNNLFKEAEQYVADIAGQREDIHLITIGKKATQHFGKRN